LASEDERVRASTIDKLISQAFCFHLLRKIFDIDTFFMASDRLALDDASMEEKCETLIDE
jgi:hypothetical protein